MGSDQRKKKGNQLIVGEALHERDSGRPVQEENIEALQAEKIKNQRLRREIFRFQQKEQLVYKAQEHQTQASIQAVREELVKLIKSIGRLSREVETAVIAEPVEPGVYHLTFFEKLKELLQTVSARVSDSANWLAVFNSRAKRRNYYWQQAKKSGTKFTLSSERRVATQVG